MCYFFGLKNTYPVSPSCPHNAKKIFLKLKQYFPLSMNTSGAFQTQHELSRCLRSNSISDSFIGKSHAWQVDKVLNLLAYFKPSGRQCMHIAVSTGFRLKEKLCYFEWLNDWSCLMAFINRLPPWRRNACLWNGPNWWSVIDQKLQEVHCKHLSSAISRANYLIEKKSRESLQCFPDKAYQKADNFFVIHQNLNYEGICVGIFNAV